MVKRYIEALPLTERQKNVIVGSLLGDANLYHNHQCPQQNWGFAKLQSKIDINGFDKISYVNWHVMELHPYSLGICKRMSNLHGKKFPGYKYYTHAHPVFTELSKQWYKRDGNGNLIFNKYGKIIKIVPSDIKLTPLALCVWYIDDGYNCQKDANVTLCTNGFTVDECEFLRERLDQDLNIKHTAIQYDRGKPTIFIGRKSYFEFIDIVKPCVTWDCYSYKMATDGYTKTSNVGKDHPMSKLTDRSVCDIFTMRDRGMMNKDIANVLGVSASAIAVVLNGKRWSHLNMPVRKSNRCRPQLTKQQIGEIISLAKSGVPTSKIAKLFGVNVTTIARNIKKYREISI